MARIKMVLITEQVVMDNSATQTNVATQQPPVNSVQPMDPAKKNKLILGIWRRWGCGCGDRYHCVHDAFKS